MLQLWSKIFFCLFFVIALACEVSARVQTHEEQAQLLFKRLAGIPILISDPRYPLLVENVAAGRLEEAAAIAVEDSGFYQVTLKNWAARMLSQTEGPYDVLNDAQATVIGTIRDDLDARSLLIGDTLYGPDPRLNLPRPSRDTNNSYLIFETTGRSLKRFLYPYKPQWERNTEDIDPAGVLTTRGWAETYYSAGTNRRAVDGAFRAFLCSPIQTWMDRGLPTYHIRRDVDRHPSGSASTFQTLCRSCHAPMDSLAGAFAHLDFVNGSFQILGSLIAPKYNQNAQVYPEGYVTTDDRWVNLITRNHNARFGWRGELEGRGVRELGQMIASSRGFSECMVERVYKQVCRKGRDSLSPNSLAVLADGFEADNYKLKGLFARTAAHLSCLGSEPDPVLKDYREILHSFATVTGVSAATTDIQSYYSTAFGRLPRDGLLNELTAPAATTLSALAALFCKKMIESDSSFTGSDLPRRRAHRKVDFTSGPEALTQEIRASVINEYAELFWQRSLATDEMGQLDELIQLAAEGAPSTPLGTEATLLTACTAAAGSTGFLINE